MNTEQRKSTDAGRADRSSRSDSAQIILIPKQLRAEWMDAMAVDPDLSPMAYKVAGVIGSHFNRHSGDTFLSRETIADAAGLSLRSIVNAVAELERLGYLIVKRRELAMTAEGRKVYGGRGVANVYLPAFQRSQVAATNAGRRLAEHVDETWERVHESARIRRRKGAPACTQSDEKGCTGVHPSEGESVQGGAGKSAPACTPTLGNPSDCNPARGRAAARVNAAAHPLGAAADGLRKVLGPGGFESWFGEVTLLGLEGGILRLGTPTRFVRDYLQQRHEFDALRSWNAVHGKGPQEAQRVEFEVVA